ncbi:MAG: glutamine-hydrolyzing carbamoyl-phosphate synthase small subunit, partial [Dehalococcoidia bacterium]
VNGFVVREHCELPSHYQSRRTLHEFLESQGVPGLSDIDTRAVTRRLRSRGVMMGVITSQHKPEEALELLKRQRPYGELDLVQGVTAETAYRWPDGASQQAEAPRREITLVDMGLKYNIMRILQAKGCRVTATPASTCAADLLAAGPDGIVLSPGPGDPALLDYMTATARGLIGRVPLMGICLGHQVLAHALGGKTYKLKFGHHGGNHPVKDLATGQVHITAQNHGYAVDADSLPPDVTVSHVNLNDGTVEGIRHEGLPLLSIQYHSEASPGPLDSVAMFDRFLDLVRDAGAG